MSKILSLVLGLSFHLTLTPMAPAVPAPPTFTNSLFGLVTGQTTPPTLISPITFLWDANPATDNVMGYRLVADQTIHDVGNVLTFTEAFGNGPHSAALLAYNTAGVSGLSNTVTFTVTGSVQPPDPCLVGGPLTLAITGYTTTVTIGDEGEVRYKASGPSPIVLVQVRLVAGAVSQVIGEIKGTGIDLRFVRAIGFGVPRVPDTYNLFLTVSDQRGCNATTTLARPLVVS